MSFKPPEEDEFHPAADKTYDTLIKHDKLELFIVLDRYILNVRTQKTVTQLLGNPRW